MDMKTPLMGPAPEAQAQWTPTELVEQDPNARERPGLLKRWYRWTAPPEVPLTASLQERELVRRGQLTSIVLLIITIVMVLPALAALFTANFSLLINLLLSLLIDVVAIVLNRRGRIIAAGLLVLLMIAGSTGLGLLFLPGGLDTSALPLFDLMVQGELVAVSLLPPLSVFPVMVINCIFFWAILAFTPHTHALDDLLKTRGYSILVVPIVLQILVAVVSYLWVRSTTQAIKRADRAEVIASLEHTLTQQNQQIVEQKQQLEEGIEQLVRVHTQAANGNLSIRASMPADRSLWPLAGSLNTLLSRFQRALRSETEQRQEQAAASAFMEALHRAKGGPLRWQQSGTYFDQLAQQYNLYHRDR